MAELLKTSISPLSLMPSKLPLFNQVTGAGEQLHSVGQSDAYTHIDTELGTSINR